MRLSLAVFGLILLAGCGGPARVGPSLQGMVIPTGQTVRGAGELLELSGRPVDAVLTPDGKTLLVKDFNALKVVDVATWKVTGTAAVPGGSSLTGIACSPDGKTCYVTNATDSIHVFSLADLAKPALGRSIKMPGPEGKGNSFPCGLALLPGGEKALVALSLNNSVAEVDLASGKVLREVAVGIAPYTVALDPGLNVAVVTEQGGPVPGSDVRTAKSAGADVEVDERGIAARGSCSVIDLASFKPTEIETGLQASGLAVDTQRHIAYVCDTNEDSVSVIDLKAKSRKATWLVKPDNDLPFGSMPTAAALSDDGKTLYVANAGNNALAVVDTGSGKVRGFVPTDWYPAAVTVTPTSLLVVNNKGMGSRPPSKAEGAARNSHDKGGTLRKATIPSASSLAQMTKQALADALVPQSLAAMERQENASAKPVPIPRRLGEPSSIKHVVYVIKENRTYDQVFGDIPGAEGRKELCIFGEEVTPNQHALAKQYVLLDNYYCNGVLSADGHSWATEGNVTPYLNRAFGGFSRSYTFGNDPITYSSSGFIWDGVLAAGYSFRNYGEMDDAGIRDGRNGKQVYADFVAGKRERFDQDMQLVNLRRYSCRDYPGWNMGIPDVLRMDRFLEEFREFEKKGELPNFMVLYLPQDHTGGSFTPRAHVADNDLAVGRLIEALSKSQFWKDTAVFINEDDPQAGTDHIDGHRSTCLVVSPYTFGVGKVSEFYNQVAVLKTINQIFGISPMNQRDSSANLMSACFTAKPVVQPFKSIPSNIPLDETRATSQMSADELAMFREVQKIDLSEREVQTPEQMDLLNRWLWHQQKGFETPYPAEFAGAHGKGLKLLGLTLGGPVEDDD